MPLTTIESLEGLKQAIAKAKSERDMLAGKQSTTMERLKQEFQCDSIPAANKLLKQTQAEQRQLSERLEQGLAELQQKYEW